MKFLLLLVAVGVLVWMLTARSRGGKRAPPPPGKTGPVTMVSCTHCGVHLPANEALLDSAGRHFCSEAHRLAGPR